MFSFLCHSYSPFHSPSVQSPVFIPPCSPLAISSYLHRFQYALHSFFNTSMLYLSLSLPISPYLSLSLPISPYLSLSLPISPYLHLFHFASLSFSNSSHLPPSFSFFTFSLPLFFLRISFLPPGIVLLI